MLLSGSFWAMIIFISIFWITQDLPLISFSNFYSVNYSRYLKLYLKFIMPLSFSTIERNCIWQDFLKIGHWKRLLIKFSTVVRRFQNLWRGMETDWTSGQRIATILAIVTLELPIRCAKTPVISRVTKGPMSRSSPFFRIPALSPHQTDFRVTSRALCLALFSFEKKWSYSFTHWYRRDPAPFGLPVRCSSIAPNRPLRFFYRKKKGFEKFQARYFN